MATVIGTSGHDNLGGTADNDSIIGLAGNDTIRGGLGVDTIEGGIGDDVYYAPMDGSFDVIIEQVGAGIDTIITDMDSYMLGANVENLYLRGSATLGVGNELNNYVVGNASNNVLSGSSGIDTVVGGFGNDTCIGGGGSDNDVLIGGAGADYFTFYTANEGNDTITDFSRAERDKIALSASGFGGGLIGQQGVTEVNLLCSQFVIGAGATNSNHRVIYNSSTGALFFDVDGTGASAQVQIASLSTGLALNSNDFQILG